MGDKKTVPYKTLERYCIQCGSIVVLPIPKRSDGGELIHCCSACSLAYRVKYVKRTLKIPKYNPEAQYWFSELSVSVDFSVTSWEMDKGNSKIRDKYFKKSVDRRNKHKQF